MKTLRQQIIDELGGTPLDLLQLSQALGISEREILNHLPHIAKSLVHRNSRFAMVPARCVGCGFEFKERRRFSPPGRCPRCKQSRIQGPWYQVTGSS
jgi:transcriptional regulator